MYICTRCLSRLKYFNFVIIGQTKSRETVRFRLVYTIHVVSPRGRYALSVCMWSCEAWQCNQPDIRKYPCIVEVLTCTVLLPKLLACTVCSTKGWNLLNLVALWHSARQSCPTQVWILAASPADGTTGWKQQLQTVVLKEVYEKKAIRSRHHRMFPVARITTNDRLIPLLPSPLLRLEALMNWKHFVRTIFSLS